MFKPNYNSLYKQHFLYANREKYWCDFDSESNYQKNLKEKYNLLKINGYIDKSFTYKFNSHSFRCDEFTSEPTIMFLGCSCTIGVGLPIDTIWPELVANKLNMKCANLGIAGGSIDTAFRMCHGWIDIIKPKLVILLHPPGGRLELVSKNFIMNLSTAWNNIKTEYEPFVKAWGEIDDNNIYLNSLKNTLAIDHICSSKNIKLLKFDFSTYSACAEENDYARDLTHLGVKANQNFASIVLSNT